MQLVAQPVGNALVTRRRYFEREAVVGTAEECDGLATRA
jgi:hypothetical protein